MNIMLLPNWMIVWLGVAGVSAYILGARSAGIVLITPAIIRFAIFPLMPVPEGEMRIVAMGVIPLLAVFGGILLLKRLVNAVYGPQTAGHVAGTYLVRIFDHLGWPLGFTALLLLAALIWIFYT